MTFEWDENKRLTNLAKHKLDFVVARRLFDGRVAVTAPSNYQDETRFVTTAMIGEKFYSALWTWRGEARRIVSFRRARDAEERAYRQVHGC